MMPAQLRVVRLAVLLLAAGLVLLGLWWWGAGGGTLQVGPGTSTSRTAGDQPTGDEAVGRTAPAAPGRSTGVAPRTQAQQPDRRLLPLVDVSDLPREARQTLELIRQGGPFPYERDGVTFLNREGLLPAQPRGYYREYTVPTPGESDRGARRIVAGREGDRYYTDDHYDSFRLIREGP